MAAVFHSPDAGSSYSALRLPLYVPAVFPLFFLHVPANVDLSTFALWAELEWQVKSGEL